MSQSLWRRSLVISLILTLAFGSFLFGRASAEQGNMVNARDALTSAYNYLKAATPDKGGHRSNAMNLTEQAIHQVNQGIRYANEHGDG